MFSSKFLTFIVKKENRKVELPFHIIIIEKKTGKDFNCESCK